MSEHIFGPPATPPGSDLDPDIARFVREVTAAFAVYPGFGSLPFPRQRQIAEQVRARWTAGGPAMARTCELQVPSGAQAVRIRIHVPGPPATRPALTYLHGGGWTYFSIDTHDRLMREYAAGADVVVVGVDYALAPESRFPVALRQVLAVVRWLRVHAPEIGIDGDKLVLGGDSAGGNLAAAAALTCRDDGHGDLIRALLLNYAALDRHCSERMRERYGGAGYMLGADEMEWFWTNYIGPGDAPAMQSGLYPLRGRLEGLPPVFLAIAECDILAEQNLAMAERLRRAGVVVQENVYRGASHSFLEAMSIAALSRRAIADTCGWLRTMLAQ